MATDPYADLYFKRAQLFLSKDEAFDVASDFWNTGSLTAERLTDKDRAFIQRALLIAVDMSEKSGILFDLYSAVLRASVKKSVETLVKGLAMRTAKRWFNKRIDDSPKINAVGKAGIQYSGMATEWRIRVGLDDDSELTNYLIE